MKDMLWLIRKITLSTFRDYKNVLMFLGFPIVGLLLSLLIYGGQGGSDVQIGIVNRDGDRELTRDAIRFVEGLERLQTSEVAEAEVKEQVASGRLDAALIIPEGFAQGLANGNPLQAEIVAVRGSEIAPYIQASMNAYLHNVSALARSAQGEEAFGDLYAKYKEEGFRLTSGTVEDRSVNHQMARQSVGYLIVLMLFSAVQLSGRIVAERENRTYLRIMSAPVSARSYIGAHIAVNFSFMLVQIGLTLLVMTQLFHMDPGIPLWQLYILLLIFAFAAIGFSFVLIAFSDSTLKANALQNTIIIPTSVVAGCMFPIESMPEWMGQTADLLPQHWVLDTFGKLQQGEAVSSMVLNVGILIAFAATFSLAAAYRFGRKREGSI